jgi:hypothetical protein
MLHRIRLTVLAVWQHPLAADAVLASGLVGFSSVLPEAFANSSCLQSTTPTSRAVYLAVYAEDSVDGALTGVHQGRLNSASCSCG